MNKKELVQKWTAQLAEVELKLKMVSFLAQNGADVNEDEMNALLDRMQTLKKLIKEIEK